MAYYQEVVNEDKPTVVMYQEPTHPSADIYQMVQVPANTDSFYNALKVCLRDCSSILGDMSVAAFRERVAGDIEFDPEIYMHLFPAGLDATQTAQRIREGLHHADVLEMVAFERTSGYKIKVLNADGSQSIQDNYASKKPLLMLKQIGVHYNAMTMIDISMCFAGMAFNV